MHSGRQDNKIGNHDMKRHFLLAHFLMLAVVTLVAGQGLAQNNPMVGGTTAAPDEWLLDSRGQPWWYNAHPAENPSALRTRAPTAGERAIVDRARDLLNARPAKAIALVDGEAIVYMDFKAPASADSLLFGFSMGKTVTGMAVGRAICDGKLKLDTKAGDGVSQLKDAALGQATVRDLLRMASGTTEPFSDSTIWTPEQFKRWNQGNLTIMESVTEERVSKAARGVFSDYKPGERFVYKSTDPLVLGLMVTRAIDMPYSHWVQKSVLDPMGAAKAGFIIQDKEGDGLAGGGVRLHMEDWIRFAQWVKRSSKEQSCFGDFVRASMSTQIDNPGTPATRKAGKLFGGYGYLIWTDNAIAPDTVWALGHGGQRIGWHRKSDRMVILFSNLEDWMPDVYELARDWNRIGR
jgi:CubicO group peptidase (beta-lactamase class C family)